MYIKRHVSIVVLYFISWRIIVWSLFTGVLAMVTYQYMHWHWVAVPWLPISLIGIAVAFFVGFKNNQSYDRSWEARKVWGSIVNVSRSFAAAARAFIVAPGNGTSEDADKEKRTLIHRHIAWLYALRHAMWQRTAWEHTTAASRRQRRYFEKQFTFDMYDAAIGKYLNHEEQQWLYARQNAPTQLLDRQSQHLADLRRRGLIEEFHHVELQNLITALYAEQGGSERIKNTPLPRQYSTSGTIFIILFTFLLPFGMLGEFGKLGESFMWLLVPFNLVVSWVFSLMDYIGDYSENPFEGLMNDVPLTTIVRNIEIDLLEMIGEKDLPEKIKPIRDVLF